VGGERERKILISNVERGRTYIDEFVEVALAQIMQHARFTEVSQIGHVFDFLEFRWIDGIDKIALERLFLLME
jgi:hypothetical protein